MNINKVQVRPAKYKNIVVVIVVSADGEHAMMRTLRENNIECPLPVLDVYGAEKSLEKLGDGIFDASVTINVDFCGISRCAAKNTVVRTTMPSDCDAPCGAPGL